MKAAVTRCVTLFLSAIAGALVARGVFWGAPLPLVLVVLLEHAGRARRRVAEREHMQEEAAQVVALQAAFLARLAHDLRTPLTVIKGYAELLAEHDDEFLDDERQAIACINVNAERLAAAVEMHMQVAAKTSGMVQHPILTIVPTKLPEALAQISRHVVH